jgi:hypothetical protein
MNRSILIVICDFLLVSLLAFSTVDINQATDHARPPMTNLEMATNRVEGGSDLTAVMRQALEQEKEQRDTLMGELAKARTAASERERQVLTTQQELQTKSAEATRLQTEEAQLQAQYAASQTNLLTLTEDLQKRTTEATAAQAQLASDEAALQKEREQTAALQKQLAQAEQSRQAVLAEKQQLSTQLQVSQAEQRAATQQVAQMQEQVKVEREEKARLTAQAEKLAEGVKALATNSSQLAQEVRDNRPMAANTIYSDYVSNRVEAAFSATRAGFFGADASRRRETDTVLATDGTNIFALCHVQETPLVFWNPGTDWEGLTGTLTHGLFYVQIRSICFSQSDPRVVMMPVTGSEVHRLGCKVYHVSADPFKFQDAILVGAKGGYYGECRFEMDLSTPDYVRLDRNVLKGLFGKFNPSRGDLVFSRTGDLLGVMANANYCSMVRNFNISASVKCDPDVREQHTGETLSRLYGMVAGLPFKLQ